MRKKVMLVFGTRPEAIKMAPLVLELEKHKNRFETIVCLTGQHREMLTQVTDLFGIVPHYNLDIMKQGQDLYDLTTAILLGLRGVLKQEKPDLVLVHGDTSTSTTAALAAFYQQIAVGHIEAGLRTHNKYSPWPEEMNRQITSRIADYHFVPTLLSKQNLLQENIDENKIFITGNTVIDALHHTLSRIAEEKELQEKIEKDLKGSNLSNSIINNLFDDTPPRMVLITGHRRENFGEGFKNICKAIQILAAKFPDVSFIYPMHLNPNVRRPIEEIFGDNNFPNVHFIEPLSYLAFVFVMEKSTLILTDSGGIQEEAPGIGKPVLVMRNTTERPEAVEAGTVKLVGTNCDLIVEEATCLLTDTDVYDKMARQDNPYGDGKAASYIVNALKKIFEPAI